jgi:FkbM family methyltransferase
MTADTTMRRVPPRLSLARGVCRYAPPVLAQMLRARIYTRARAFKDDYEFVMRSQTGLLLKSRTSDHAGYPFSVHGYYDWHNVAIAMALCRPGDTIVEVGAHIGTETISYAAIVGATGRVIAFEPMPDNLAALEGNLRMNRLDNVTVLPQALSDTQGVVDFAIGGGSGSGAGHLRAPGDRRDASYIRVQTTTLDAAVFEQAKPIRMLFIDAEGAELGILRGGGRLLSRDTPHLVLEASERHLSRAGTSIAALRDDLTARGYDVHRISRWGLQPAGAQRTAGNWLCVHRSRRNAAGAARRSLLRAGVSPCVRGLNPLTRRSRPS